MHQRRQGHSSCVQGRNLWVFGGTCGHNFVSTIELSDLIKNTGFEQIQVPLISMRANPAVCVLNDSKILVAGGSYEGKDRDDAIIFDSAFNTAKPAELVLSTRGNAIRGQSYKVSTGTAVSLTVNKNDQVQLMTYSRLDGLFRRVALISQDPI